MSDLFISYQSADPLAHSFQVQLQEWAQREWEFPTIRFHEQQPPVKFNGRQSGHLRREIHREIKQSHQVLIVISRETWQSEWTDWEILMARKEDKQVLAAKLDSTNMMPLALMDSQPIWIDPFRPEDLVQRII